MFVVYAILAILLGLGLLASGAATITRQPPIVANFSRAGVPDAWYPALGTLKILGALGLIVGLWVPVLGILAGFALFAYFVGAVVMHLRAGDRAIAPALAIAVLALVAALLRIATA